MECESRAVKENNKMGKQFKIVVKRLKKDGAYIVAESMWVDATDEELEKADKMLQSIGELAYLKIPITKDSAVYVPEKIIIRSLAFLLIREV